jgi:hypothetical protein
MAAMADDIICILYGCSVPVVLRQQKGENGCFYQLVGEYYVHGMMDGGAVEYAVIIEINEEEFELR